MKKLLSVEYTVIHKEGSGLLSDAFQKIIKDHHDFIKEKKPDIDAAGEVVTENGSFAWAVSHD